MIAVHREGQARSLDLLTLDDCASVGTALGAIHRLPNGISLDRQISGVHHRPDSFATDRLD